MSGETSVKVLGCAEGWEILFKDRGAEMLGELGYGMDPKEQLSGLGQGKWFCLCPSGLAG